MTAKRYEIAAIHEDGTIERGGISATLATVKRWIKKNEESFPCYTYIAVEASEDAITYEEYLEECREAQRA